MPGNLQPLDQKFAIVDADGRPTLYFIKWAQQRQIDITAGITKEEAIQLIADFMEEHQLQEGVGISITPDGNLANDPTIALDALLGDLNDVDTTTTPPTDGQALIWDDAAQLWVPGDVASGGGGGGGSLQQLAQIVLTASAATIDFQGISQDYDDLVIVWQVRGETAAALANVRGRLNNDSGANYDGEEIHAYSSGTNFTQYTAQTSADIGNMAANTADATRSGFGVIEIPAYARTAFMKQMLCNWGNSYSTGGFTQGTGQYSSTWRSTAAVNRFTLLPSAGNFVAGSVCTIYGRGKTPKVWPGNVIFDYTCSGGETFVDIPNIPQTFDDLIMVVSGRSTRAANDDQFRMRFNGDTGNNYAWQVGFFGTGYTGFQGTAAAFMELPQLTSATATANRTTAMEIQIIGYAKNVFNKTISAKSSEWESNQRSQISAGVWYNNSPVTSIRVFPTTAFVAGSRIVLYGRGGPGGQTIYSRPWYWKPPVASSFALSSGDATQLTLADDADVGLTFTTPPATTNIIRMFYRTLTNKALDWDLVMRFNLHLDPLNFSFFGIFAKDSIGGRLTWWGLSHGASDRVEQLKFNNQNNGYNSSYGSADVRGVFQWLRLRADGLTMRYYTSTDGKMWMEWGSHPVLDFLANRPDQLGIGFCINRTGGATPMVGSIDHFNLTGPAV